MHGIHYKERWHSDGCLLYFRGGHRRNLCQAGLHPSVGCALLHSCGTHSPFSYHRLSKTSSCDITGETELHDEAITVRAVAPTEAHISTYTMVWCAKPLKGVEGHTHLPSKLPQVGKHHVASRQS